MMSNNNEISDTLWIQRWRLLRYRRGQRATPTRMSSASLSYKKSRISIYKVKRTDKTCKRAVVIELVSLCGLCVRVYVFRECNAYVRVCLCVTLCVRVCLRVWIGCVQVSIQSPWIQHTSLPWYRTVLIRNELFLFFYFPRFTGGHGLPLQIRLNETPMRRLRVSFVF